MIQKWPVSGSGPPTHCKKCKTTQPVCDSHASPKTLTHSPPRLPATGHLPPPAMADVDTGELPQTPRSATGDDELSLMDGEPDLAAAVLARLGGSPREDDQHLCATAAAMAQAVRDQGVAATPVAYFAAAAAALAPLARAGAGAADRHVSGALLAFLSAAVPALPPAVARARGREVADDVVRVLEFPSTPDSGVRAGVRCLAHLISAGEKANWEAVEPLYGVVLRLAVDPRPKVLAKYQFSQLCCCQNYYLCG